LFPVSKRRQTPKPFLASSHRIEKTKQGKPEGHTNALNAPAEISMLLLVASLPPLHVRDIQKGDQFAQ
jgi:hypothetical protein